LKTVKRATVTILAPETIDDRVELERGRRIERIDAGPEQRRDPRRKPTDPL
jgi:hypothetical protein